MQTLKFKSFSKRSGQKEKTRIAERTLSEDEFCDRLYGEIQNEGTCGWFVKQSHIALEKHLPPLDNSCDVLELGCNHGEHSPYVTHPYASYKSTDYRPIDFVPLNDRISFEIADAQNLSYPDNSFDRIIMTCVLHHLKDPMSSLQEMRRVARSNATISILLPTDPGLLYRIGKVLGPYRTVRNQNLDFDPRFFHYQQHQNHFPGLKTMIDHVFKSDQIREIRWPLPWHFWNLNLFSVFQIKVDK